MRGREASGELTGLLVHDARDPGKPTTMMAERGALVDTDTGPRFVLVKGNRQELDIEDGVVSFLFFDRYTLDLGQFAQAPARQWRKPGERYLGELLSPDGSAEDAANASEMLSEAHQRLTAPLYAIAFVLIAVSSLFYGDYDRRRDWIRIVTAVVAVMVVQTLALAFTSVVSNAPELTPLMYANVAVPIAACLYLLAARRHGSAPRRVDTGTA